MTWICREYESADNGSGVWYSYFQVEELAEKVEDLVEKYFENNEASQLLLLSSKLMTEGVTRYVGGDGDALDMIVK